MTVMTNTTTKESLSKVPALTLVFWMMKIAATTFGETAGDAVSMSMNLGYLLSTAIFACVFLLAVTCQILPTVPWASVTLAARLCC